MSDALERPRDDGTDDSRAAEHPTRVDGAGPPLASIDGSTSTLLDADRPAPSAKGLPRLPEPAVGTTLDRFVIISQLGRGGMGTVYEAFDRELDRRVAVKVLRNDVNPTHQQRLIREAKALAQLNHRNVVQVYEVGHAQGRCYVAMELIRGKDLRSWQQGSPRPAWKACVDAYRQAGEGLAAAHRQGLIHRDFKPANAIIDDEGRVRVLDFGLARPTNDPGTTDARTHAAGLPIASNDDRLTETGFVMGTPAYMPLEQMLDGRVDARSDQFSFCVALWEALYGERPFVERPRGAHVMALRNAEVREAPEDSTVPSRLRELLLRGLSPEPGDRWPSMDALLEPLEQLTTPRRRPWAWIGGGVAVLGVGLFALGLARGHSGALGGRACSGARAQLEGVWDADRRDHVRQALSNAERSYARSTADRVSAMLDEHAAAWTSKHAEVCEATRVTQEQSEAVMDLRMDCLRDQRMALGVVVDVLTTPDPRVVDEAIELVQGLPPPSRCDDAQRLAELRQRVPPPSDPQLVLEVDRIREQLEAARARQQTGAFAEALEVVEPLVLEAEDLGYAPVIAEAKLRHGWLLEAAAHYPEAEQVLLAAHVLAVEHDHETVELGAARALGVVVGLRRARLPEGLQWVRTAVPLSRRIGDASDVASTLEVHGSLLDRQGEYDEAETVLRRSLTITEDAQGSDALEVSYGLGHLAATLYHQGEFAEAEALYARALSIREQHLSPSHPLVASNLMSLGVMVNAQGRYDEAETRYRRALEIHEVTLGLDHPKVASAAHSLASVLDRQGRRDEAAELFHRALRVRRRTMGSTHPDVADTLNNLGNLMLRQGKYEESEPHYREAVAIIEQALGPDHPKLGAMVNNLANAHFGQGELDDAEQQYRRALAIKETELGSEHPSVALTIDNLGNVYGAMGQLDDAESHHRRALEIREAALGPMHAEVANSLHNLASVLLRRGDLTEAGASYRRALTITEEALGSEHTDAAESHVGLANVAIEQERPQDARKHAQRALSIYDAKGGNPDRIASARFALAQSLWSEPSERQRAYELASQARDALQQMDGVEEPLRNRVERWIRRHRAP